MTSLLSFAFPLLALFLSGSASAANVSQRFPLDTHWLKTAAEDHMTDAELGHIAHQKSLGTEAQQFGDRTAADHSRALKNLRSYAYRKSLLLPNDPHSAQKSVLDFFRDSDSPDWELDYLRFEIASARNAIQEIRNELQHGSDPEARGLAREELVSRQRQLSQAQQLVRSYELTRER